MCLTMGVWKRETWNKIALKTPTSGRSSAKIHLSNKTDDHFEASKSFHFAALQTKHNTSNDSAQSKYP